MIQNKKKLALLILFTCLLGIGLSQGQNDVLFAQSDPTRTLYVFGDSWTAQMASQHNTFQTALSDRNLDSSVQVVTFAEGGSTAAGWAADDPCNPSCAGRFTSLKTAITNDPLSDPVVFLTLGGNDLLFAFQNGPTQAAYAPIAANLRTILTELTQTRSDLQIFIGGYDILNPAVSAAQCNFLLNQVFGTTDPSVSNPYQIQLQDTITTVANEFAKVKAINTYGSLQGNPGNPDITQWSDVQFIQDCIHLNGAGYAIYIGTVFDQGLNNALLVAPSTLTERIYLPIIRRDS